MLDCPAFDLAVSNYQASEEALATAAASKSFYEEIGSVLLMDVLPYEETWDFYFAYTIFDYVHYQATHNASFAGLLEGTDWLDRLRWYADQQQYGWYVLFSHG